MEQKSKRAKHAAPLGLVSLVHPLGRYLITLETTLNNSYKGYFYLFNFQTFVSPGRCSRLTRQKCLYNFLNLWVCDYHNTVRGLIALAQLTQIFQFSCFVLEPNQRSIMTDWSWGTKYHRVCFLFYLFICSEWCISDSITNRRTQISLIINYKLVHH